VNGTGLACAPVGIGAMEGVRKRVEEEFQRMNQDSEYSDDGTFQLEDGGLRMFPFVDDLFKRKETLPFRASQVRFPPSLRDRVRPPAGRR
jgi:hypothetical protein